MQHSPLHERLRRETREEHVGLEEMLAQRGSFATLSGYVCYLQGFYAFQCEAERRLALCGVDSVIDDWSARQRAHLARRDLEVLGAEPGEAESMRGGAVAHGWVVTPRVEHILGMAYVLEGATLGGAVLLDSLRPLGVTATFGGSFLESYGHARGRMWRGFLARLAAWEARGVSATEIIRAANGAFRAARSALSGSREPRRSFSSESRAQPPASR
jgi:heme oxygenase